MYIANTNSLRVYNTDGLLLFEMDIPESKEIYNHLCFQFDESLLLLICRSFYDDF